MKAAIQAHKNKDNTAINPCAELDAYLAAPLEDNVEDVVSWWGVVFNIQSLSRILTSLIWLYN